METNIIIHGTNANTGEKTQQTVTDINPNASNNAIKTFAQALNGLTNNSYVETERIDKTNVDLDEKNEFRDITVTGAIRGENATISANIAEGDTINPAVFYYSNGSVQVLSTTPISSEDTTVAKLTVTIPNNSGQLFIGLTARENFYADFVSATVE